MDDFRLDEPIRSEGLSCRICGKPLDTKTTVTLLCKSCKHKKWSQDQRQRFKDKYGIDNPMRDPEIVSRIQNTMKERYGANCAMNVPKFRDKLKHTMQERYGVDYYTNSPDFIGISPSNSKTNDRFDEFLKKNGINAEREAVYDNKRFDFKIKSQRILIEIDPTFTHCATTNVYTKAGNPVDYQLAKTLLAQKYDYRCIHVFDWDNWESILQLICPKDKIYARKCQVKVIEDKSYDNFIDDNHIQKQCKGTKIALGLYYNDELVQVMTFGKPRYNKNYQWELLRLCSSKDKFVIGGASKLFKYATQTLGLTSIISYCDRSKFSGQVYTQMGMTLLRYSVPQEVWSKGTNRVTGSLLRQRGYDQLFGTNFGKGTSNEQLMIDNGWLPVYDCGQAVFIFGEAISKSEDSEEDPRNYQAILASLVKREQAKEKICAFCGEPFIPNSNQQRYCKRPHYMNCPVCGKKYLVTNNENLKRPPVACSYECRKVRREETSLKRYGIKAPGSTPEAREKARKTMQERYGVDYAMESKEIYEKGVQTLLEKYGVDNIQKVDEVTKQGHIKRNQNWIQVVHDKLPIKPDWQSSLTNKNIDDSKMAVYLLNEKTSQDFLSTNGIRPVNTFGKIHLSIGLVYDKTIYQVMRFERKSGENGSIILADFGTLSGYTNPNNYDKLMRFATGVRGIDSFTAQIPRHLASDKLLDSLSVRKENDGEYEVYWKIEQKNKLICVTKLVKLTQRDNIDEMLAKYDYITTDYLDQYVYVLGKYKDCSEMIECTIQASELG